MGGGTRRRRSGPGLQNGRPGGRLSSVANSFSYESYTAGQRGAWRGLVASAELRVPIGVIRHAVELAVAGTSLRIVADEIGMTAMTVRAFIRADGQPQPRTLRKLNKWYARHAAERDSDGMNDVRSALIVLAGLVPQASRSRLEARVLRVLEDGFRENGISPPGWLAALRAEVAPVDG